VNLVSPVPGEINRPGKPITPGKPRLAVVSPFLDKRHGTERCIAEQLERLAGAYEIHLYSERVGDDVDLTHIVWHRVFIPPGPHLLRYLWWFAGNHLCRWIDRHFRGLAPCLVYSPGVNCLDADVICVHAIFSKLREQKRESLRFRGNPWKLWPLLAHRRMYYRLCAFLERHVYANSRVALAAVSQRTSRDLAVYVPNKDVAVVYNGIDSNRFNSPRRLELRALSRAALGIPAGAFIILMVGNDWKSKGLPCLLDAVGRLPNPAVQILIAGQDTAAPYQESIRRLRLSERVFFLPVRSDVEFYYAAADAYASPSVHDAFALPVAEAMACGLPVITSQAAGVSEIITSGVDGLILEDPGDAQTLSTWLERLSTDTEWRTNMGAAAARTAAQYTWERNALEIRSILDSAAEVTLARGSAVKETRT
jgi:glycosyltransferase involved in cell wall biosynthesis